MSSSTDTRTSIDPLRVVDNAVYYDADIYEKEISRVFSRSWQIVGHESEVGQIGDFYTREIAGSPIIVVRSADDVVRAFFNTCRHRGALVVGDSCGHASSLRCPYHFWVYSLNGDLIGVPGDEPYDGSGFSKDQFGLVPLHCEVRLGLVFVNPAEGDVMTVDEWLGPEIIETLSTPLAKAKYVVAKTRSSELPVNWKIWAENARDGYHVPFVHPFFRKASPPGAYHLVANGHAVQRLGMSREGIDPDVWSAIHKDMLPGLSEDDGYIVTLFPDASIMVRSNFVSLDLQHVRGVKDLVFEERLLAIEGDTPETQARRSLGQETWLWNPLELEDHPIFVAQQKGVESRGVRHSIIARGADALTGTRGDDNRLRHFWKQWRAMMNFESNGPS